MVIWLNKNIYIVEYINNSLNENNYFVEFKNNYFVKYINN